MEEIWKDIVGYEGLYQVSNYGNVISVRTGITLKKWKGIGGYLNVTLSVCGQRKNHYVHRLVAEAFIPNPENKSQIDHINTNKEDNSVLNLRWATPKENMNNKLSVEKMSLLKTGLKHSEDAKRKMSDSHKGIPCPLDKKIKLGKKVICIDVNKVFYSIKEAS